MEFRKERKRERTRERTRDCWPTYGQSRSRAAAALAQFSFGDEERRGERQRYARFSTRYCITLKTLALLHFSLENTFTHLQQTMMMMIQPMYASD